PLYTTLILPLLFLSSSPLSRDPPSFPTRRSSDLTSTVKRSILVGSGTGPLTVAPVRLAVSTISRADESIRRWSNAFKRIRMFWLDRKSTRLNSSHLGISYAVFCLKKKKKKKKKRK